MKTPSQEQDHDYICKPAKRRLQGLPTQHDSLPPPVVHWRASAVSYRCNPSWWEDSPELSPPHAYVTSFLACTFFGQAFKSLLVWMCCRLSPANRLAARMHHRSSHWTPSKWGSSWQVHTRKTPTLEAKRNKTIMHHLDLTFFPALRMIRQLRDILPCSWGWLRTFPCQPPLLPFFCQTSEPSVHDVLHEHHRTAQFAGEGQKGVSGSLLGTGSTVIKWSRAHTHTRTRSESAPSHLPPSRERPPRGHSTFPRPGAPT